MSDVVNEITTNDGELIHVRAHSRARARATQELIARHRDEFDQLHQQAKHREGLK